jgi:ATP-dependent Clp protease ATP-binding subunit ClpA
MAARLAAQDVGSCGLRHSTAATGIFSAPARRLVAEDVLKVAQRLGRRSLSTGHLLLAVLENPDETTAEILDTDASQIAAEVMDALPGDEHS